MPVDYDEFRKKPWNERVTLFNAISAADKAELMRTNTARWLETHRPELSAEQVAFIEESLSFVTPERYLTPPDDEVHELARRARELFTPEQYVEAFTIQWDTACISARPPRPGR